MPCSWVPSGCSMNSFFSISSPVLNLMAHYPMGTTSANHADLLYFLAPSISAGQRPFIYRCLQPYDSHSCSNNLIMDIKGDMFLYSKIKDVCIGHFDILFVICRHLHSKNRCALPEPEFRTHRDSKRGRLLKQPAPAKTKGVPFHLGKSMFTDDATYIPSSWQELETLCATDKICMMTTRLACNRAIESSYWRMDNDSDVGLLMGYVLYQLLVELEFMAWFGYLSPLIRIAPFSAHKLIEQDTAVLHQAIIVCTSL
jgi:hypothetical protein